VRIKGGAQNSPYLFTVEYPGKQGSFILYTREYFKN
jgi:hypothetical protein